MTFLPLLFIIIVVFAIFHIMGRPLQRKAGAHESAESWSDAGVDGSGNAMGAVIIVVIATVLVGWLGSLFNHGERGTSAFAAALLFGGFVMVMGALKEAARHRRCAKIVEQTPLSRTDTATDGHVELQGKLACHVRGKPILSPLSKTPCVWWRLTVHRRHRRNHHWSLERSSNSSVLLMLDDGKGCCHIDPEGARISAPLTTYRYGHRDQPPASGIREQGFFSRVFGGYRYTEEVLCEGQTVFAHGQFSSSAYDHPAFVAHADNCPAAFKLLHRPGNKNNPFSLTFRSEEEVLRYHRSMARRLTVTSYVVGLVLATLAMVGLMSLV